MPYIRPFTQFNSLKTNEMKRHTLQEMIKQESSILILFATSALGMDVNLPHIITVIHLNPSSSLELCMQEIG